MNERITLINTKSEWWEGKHKNINLNLGLLAVATALDRNGFEVSLLDMLDRDFEEVFNRRLKNSEAFVINLDVMSVKTAVDTTNNIRKTNKTAKIIWGSFSRGFFGKFVDLFPELALQAHGVDYIALSDSGLVQLIGSNYTKLEGIGYREGDRQIIDESTNLKPLLDVDYSLVDIEKNYIDRVGTEISSDRKPKRILPVFTGEGCPYGCSFCINSREEQRKRFILRAAEDIINELDLLQERYKISHVWFQDDNLFVNKKRTFKIFNYLKDQPVSWAGQGRADYFTDSYLTDGYFREIVKNCFWFGIGFENCSERLRRIFNRGKGSISIPRLYRIMDLFEGSDLREYAVAFIVGTIDETRDEMIKNALFIIDLIKKYKKLDITYQIFRPYPGTEEFEKIARKYDMGFPRTLGDYIENNPYRTLKYNVWLSEEDKEIIYYLKAAVGATMNMSRYPFPKNYIAATLSRLSEWRLKNRNFKLFWEKHPLRFAV